MKFNISKDWAAQAVKNELEHASKNNGISFSARNGYLPVQEMVTCPACRGYNLERGWCDVCSGNGFVAKAKP